jgi:hypothetical protein
MRSSINTAHHRLGNLLQSFLDYFTHASRATPEDLVGIRAAFENDMIHNVEFLGLIGLASFVAMYIQMAVWMISGENQTKVADICQAESVKLTPMKQIVSAYVKSICRLYCGKKWVGSIRNTQAT